MPNLVFLHKQLLGKERCARVNNLVPVHTVTYVFTRTNCNWELGDSNIGNE